MRRSRSPSPPEAGTRAGRIEKPDRDRLPLHRAEQSEEVALLHREEARERARPRVRIRGENHLADHLDPLGIEEHVLGATEPDALRAEVQRHGRVVRGVGVRANAELSKAVRPPHEHSELTPELARDGGDLSGEDLARPPVERDPVPRAKDPPADLELTALVEDVQCRAARDAALAHPARDHGRV